jgi:hypothetical protein
MLKQVVFHSRASSGERVIQPLTGEGLEKTASAEFRSHLHPKIQEFVHAVRPTRHGIYVLVNALGAGEFWGSNVNGDFFPEAALVHAPPGWDQLSAAEQKAVAKTWSHGYPTFLNAHAYTHHVNKDPSRAFGTVELATWNPIMHRVELVLYLDRARAEMFGADSVISRIDAGEYPDVSMGCFPAGTLVTMGDGTRKSIEQIQVGDEVLTHKGRVRKVTELHRRRYSGALHTIKAEAHRVLRATKQHPFYAVPEGQVKEKDYHANLRWCVERDIKPDWVDAEALQLDSYLLEPVPTEQSDLKTTDRTRAFARLLGYYLAEGHLLKNKKKEITGIELTTNVDDPIHDEIEQLCKDFGTANPPATFERTNSENALGIYIFDRELAELCREHAGAYSEQKRLSKEIMFWPKGLQFEMLGAYANGDGCGPVEGSLKFSTASQDLSWQVYLLLLRKGFIPSHAVLEHKATGKSNRPTTEYVVHLGKQQAPHFAQVCAKVKRSEVLKAKNSRVYALEKGSKDMFVVTPIREMSAFHVEEMEVFNFEVEEDNSYVVEGIAVHNCRVPYDVCMICEQRSKTDKDYCIHCISEKNARELNLYGGHGGAYYGFGLNRILADGRKVAVRNEKPRFFDLSCVFIGADKTAKVMAKGEERNGRFCLGSFCSIPRPSAEIGEHFSKEAALIRSDLQKPTTDALFSAFMPKKLTGSKPQPEVAGDKSQPERNHESVKTAGVFTDYFAAKDRQEEEMERSNPVPLAERSARLKATLTKLAGGKVKRQTTFDGITCKIEFDPGDTRTGVNKKTGEKWSKTMKASYGYIPKTKGEDGEAVDIYLRKDPQPLSDAYVVHQIKEDGSPDEDKVMLGYASKDEAISSYKQHTPPKFLGSVTVLSGEELNHYLEDREKTASSSSCGLSVCSCGCTQEDAEEQLSSLFLSQEKRAFHSKISELLKEVPAGPFREETLPKLEVQEKQIPTDMLDHMAQKGLGPALATSCMMGIVLKPQEFQRLVLMRMGEKPLADTMDEQNVVFPPSQETDSSVGVNPAAADEELKQLLMPLLAARSIAAPLMKERAFQASRSPKKGQAPEACPVPSPLMDKLAAAYNGYRSSLVKKASSIADHLALDPQLRSRTFEPGMAMAFATGIEKSAQARVLSPESLAYLVGAHYADRDFHNKSLAQSGYVAEAAA